MRIPAATALAALLLLLAPAVGFGAIEEEVDVSGGITVTWRGDPARGCAQAGTCDVRGSVVHEADDDLTSGGTSPGRRRLGSLRFFDAGLGGGTVDVRRGDPSAPSGTCADTVRSLSLPLAAGTPSGGRVRFAVREAATGSGGGRCGGPLSADVLAAMPVATLPASTLRSRRITLDLRGIRPFTSGSLTGEVVSTLRVTVRRRILRDRDAGVSVRDVTEEELEPRRRGPRRAILTVRYAVEGMDGSLGARLGAIGDPACRVFDACSLAGRLDLGAVRLPAGTTLVLQAAGPAGAVRGRRVADGMAALAAGRLGLEAFLDGDGPIGATVTADLTRNGAAACRDERPTRLPQLAAEGRGRTATFRLSGFGADDPLATRCPGPLFGSGEDPGGTAPLAHAAIPTSALAGATLAVPLRLAPSPGTWPFVLVPDTALTVRLRRTGAQLRVAREQSP